MDDKRDPLLGLPMKFLDIGSQGDDEEVYAEDEEVSDGDSNDGPDKLFPSDVTEEYTQIDHNQSFHRRQSTNSLFQDSPVVAGLQDPATTLTTLSLAKNDHDEDDLLPGEALQLRVTDAVFVPDRLPGTLLVTSYRFEFMPHDWKDCWRSDCYFKFPVTAILKISKKQSFPSDELTIVCKDGRQNLLFKFSSDQIAKRAYSLLLTLAFPISQGVGFRWFFCFSQPMNSNPKTLLELLSSPSHDKYEENRYRETVVNWDYSVCSSYPKTFFVPRNVPDQQLKQVAQFRSKARIPALCWFDKRLPNRGGSIWRCSQPKVGFGASFSLEDESLVEAIRRGTASGIILIVDCRSAMAAMANKARGMGTEDVSRYRGTKMQFENIANYHSVRSSYMNLCKLMNKPMSKENAADESFLVEVENTGWLSHLRAILSTSIKLAEAAGIHGIGTIVHCSDGWDRTSQITSLSQVLLDHECRTRKGFVRLIHREWVLFGHKFRDRLGVGLDGEESEERSPIFIQFLDCVWQLKKMFPKWFEFNELFLEALGHHSYSSRFIEFMGNTAQDWENAVQSDSGGCSLWEMLLLDERNDQYFHDPLFTDNRAFFIPKVQVVCRQIVLWDIFLKRSGTPSHPDHCLDASSKNSKWQWWM